ncbi:MAG TPA: DUF2917 domain-containing protein [Noviherbaspirillum sp.]|nr:DUF2917 domain-containing protein [Noviherbaspirillum sp.]
MRDLFTSEAIHLEAGEVLSGAAKRARILRIKSGSAWVTVEGNRYDYWLSAGDSLRVATGRLVVVEAQTGGFEAQTRVETAPAPLATEGMLRALLGTLRRWLRQDRVTAPTVERRCCA